MHKNKESSFSIEELQFKRIISPDFIPIYLVEQIKDREFSVPEFYEYLNFHCSYRDAESILRPNPHNHLYAILDQEKKIQGFFWGRFDPFIKTLFIHNFSVDKNYWQKGKVLERVTLHLKELIKEEQIKKIYWLTSSQKYFEKYGFKKSNTILMEYKEE